jgi:hypothetical protein
MDPMIYLATEARFWIKLAMRTVEENTCLEFVQFDPIGIAIDERFFQKGFWQKGRARKFGRQTQYIQFRHGDGGFAFACSFFLPELVFFIDHCAVVSLFSAAIPILAA